METCQQWLLWAMVMGAAMLGDGRAMSCPQVCSCRHQSDIIFANCTSLPYNVGRVEALTLLPHRDARIELRNGQFNYARHLKYLTLRNCSIYFVHNKSFYGAKNIMEIDLSFNYIEDLDPTAFQHLNNLKSLSLRGNPIHLEPEVPFLISNSLTHLDIGQCDINHIPRGIFYELKRLKYLYLDGNILSSIEYNTLPKVLKYLDISNNYIVNVPTEVISSLSNLRRLDIADNPINCSCSLLNLQDWLSGRAVIFENDVICSLPPKYNGVSWSKVNENELCLVEARTDEMSYQSSSIMDNQFDKDSPHDNNVIWDDNIQADQPSPNSEAEVLWKNDDTIGMGEMMRDEAEPNNNKEVSENTELITEEDNQEPPTHEKDTEILNLEVLSKDANGNIDVKGSDIEISSVEKVTGSPALKDYKDTISEIADLTSHDTHSNKDNEKDNLVDENEGYPTDNNVNSSESLNSNTERTTFSENNNENTVETNDSGQLGSYQLNDSVPVEFKTLTEEDTEVDEFKKEGLVKVNKEDYIVANNDNSTSEESTANPKHEGTTESEASGDGPLIEDISSENDIVTENVTSSTEVHTVSILQDPVTSKEEDHLLEPVTTPVIIPEVENTTTEEIITINIPELENTPATILPDEAQVVSNVTHITESKEDQDGETASTETASTENAIILPEVTTEEVTPNVISETHVTQSREDGDGDTTTEPTAIILPGVTNEVPSITDIETYLTKNKNDSPKDEVTTALPVTDHAKTESNETGAGNESQSLEKDQVTSHIDKVREIAGAKVVMFCIAILVLCLILYSVYKCRTSKNRQSMGISKDIESNRGTEMQDMASLLPKPQDEKKNNKYDDKAPSSETIKLLTEPNENDCNNFVSAEDGETKNTTNEKNSINNNTSNNKAPLLQPENPISTNPATPIQRTKVKVGIIPDSIPRTPIFLQKTHNGTNNV